jgi:hypothetical protein
MQDNALSSVANLQSLFWKYLPASVRALNMKADRKAAQSGTAPRVHWTGPPNGFDGLLRLPNGCEIYFLNYTQDPSDFLGWELGKDLGVALQPGIPDIGALLDENCTLAWLENILLRCSTRGAKVHWCYSPQEGITPTIKEVLANMRTVESARAELLADRMNVPGLPRGEMPVVGVDEKKHWAVYYRFTELNPFSGYANPGGVRELCLGKGDAAYTKAHAYGYCEAVRGRAFPLFGEWNVVSPEAVPARGTNWLVTDPAGARNWFTLWARACPGNEIYIYREWPSFEELGEWAVTSKIPKKLNGERGPAQPTIGNGPKEYVRLFRDRERVMVPEGLKEELRSKKEEIRNPDVLAKVTETWVKDGYHRRLVVDEVGRRLAAEEGLDGDWELSEVIFERLIDPRAARNLSAADGGGVDLIRKLEEAVTMTIAEWRMTNGRSQSSWSFVPAPGLDLRDGISQINEYLYFNTQEERVAVINAPRLYVSSACRNLIWALKHYSLPDDLERASDDACEDPVDCLRYLVTRGMRYVEPGGKVRTRGGGSY